MTVSVSTKMQCSKSERYSITFMGGSLARGLAFRRSHARLRQFALCRCERKLLVFGNDLEQAVA
jgi:hypothetical protein